jgi:hypothetical protein
MRNYCPFVACYAQLLRYVSGLSDADRSATVKSAFTSEENTRHRTFKSIATLEPLAGKISRNDLDDVQDWASEPTNLALLLEVWRRLQ